MMMKQNKYFLTSLTVSLVLAYPPTLSAAATNSGNPYAEAPMHIAMMDEMGMGGMGAAKPNQGMSSDPMTTQPQNPMSDKPSGMDMMGKMRGSMSGQHGMGKKASMSSLPGFPGASHLYHIGATGFFLDHPQHITLSVAQQRSLNRIKEKAMLDQTNTDRRIEDAEQELWMLTSADMPDAAKVEAKIEAIEKLRSSQRMSFIRAVGEAAKVLTPEQRNALLGTGPASMAPAGQAPMSDM